MKEEAVKLFADVLQLLELELLELELELEIYDKCLDSMS